MTARHCDALAVDEHTARDAGYGCGLCLDTGWLHGIGPCQTCYTDRFVEYLLDRANTQIATVWAEEHDPDNDHVQLEGVA